MRTAAKIGSFVAGAALLAGTAVGVAQATSSPEQSSPATSAYAATSLTAASPAPSTPAAGPRAKALRARLGLLRRAVHGQVTLRTRAGYTTVDFRKGKVTAVSPTSITLTSRDGTTGTFAIGSQTHVRVDRHRASASEIKTGDRALVVAVQSANGTTARLVVARSPKQTTSGADSSQSNT